MHDSNLIDSDIQYICPGTFSIYMNFDLCPLANTCKRKSHNTICFCHKFLENINRNIAVIAMLTYFNQRNHNRVKLHPSITPKNTSKSE